MDIPSPCSSLNRYNVTHAGTCVCDYPYVGEDCSIDSTASPEDVILYNDGLCDVTATDCATAVVQGFNFLPAGVQCHYQRVKVIIVKNNVLILVLCNSYESSHNF